VIFLPGSVTTRRTVSEPPGAVLRAEGDPAPSGKEMSRGCSPRISPHLRPVTETRRGMGRYQASMASMIASLATGVMTLTRRRGMVSRSTPAQGLCAR